MSIDSSEKGRRRARRAKVRLMFILFCNDAAMVRDIGGFRREDFNKRTSADCQIHSYFMQRLNTISDCDALQLAISAGLKTQDLRSEPPFEVTSKFNMISSKR